MTYLHGFTGKIYVYDVRLVSRHLYITSPTSSKRDCALRVRTPDLTSDMLATNHASISAITATMAVTASLAAVDQAMKDCVQNAEVNSGTKGLVKVYKQQSRVTAPLNTNWARGNDLDEGIEMAALRGN